MTYLLLLISLAYADDLKYESYYDSQGQAQGSTIKHGAVTNYYDSRGQSTGYSYEMKQDDERDDRRRNADDDM